MVAEEFKEKPTLEVETKVEVTETKEDVEPKTPTKRKYTKKPKPVVEDVVPKVSFETKEEVEDKPPVHKEIRESIDKGKAKAVEGGGDDEEVQPKKLPKDDEQLRQMMQKEFRKEFLVYKSEKMALKKRMREETSAQFENDKIRRQEEKQDRIYGRMFG